jgi:hypothetical protein
MSPLVQTLLIGLTAALVLVATGWPVLRKIKIKT